MLINLSLDRNLPNIKSIEPFKSNGGYVVRFNHTSVTLEVSHTQMGTQKYFFGTLNGIALENAQSVYYHVRSLFETARTEKEKLDELRSLGFNVTGGICI